MKELVLSITKNDFDISYFNGTGCGGQYRNKHANCVRMKHRASGVMGVGQSERSMEQNKRAAFRAIVTNPKFKTWHKIEIAKAIMTKEERRKMEEELERRVEELMKDEYLKIEMF